jgi:hypothetical protein
MSLQRERRKQSYIGAKGQQNRKLFDTGIGHSMLPSIVHTLAVARFAVLALIVVVVPVARLLLLKT